MAQPNTLRILTLIAVLWAAPAFGAPRDGTWWAGAPEHFKLGYVAGYVDGRDEQARSWGRIADEAIAQLPDDARQHFTPVLDALRAEAEQFQRATYGDVMGQLDAFYRLDRNRPVPLAQALAIVRQALNGVAQPYLACQTEYFRLAHDQEVPMKERLEALGRKAAQCAAMSPHGPAADADSPSSSSLPEGHPPP